MQSLMLFSFGVNTYSARDRKLKLFKCHTTEDARARIFLAQSAVSIWDCLFDGVDFSFFSV